MTTCECGHAKTAHEHLWCEGVCLMGDPQDPWGCDCMEFEGREAAK